MSTKKPVEPVATVEVETYGPYKDLRHVETEYGRFGVPRGQVMHFEQQRYYNKKQHEWETRMMPVYTPVPIDESDTPPSVPLPGKSAEENQRNVQAWSDILIERAKARAPQ